LSQEVLELPGDRVGRREILVLGPQLLDLLGLDPLDPVALTVAILALGAAMTAACAMPARRAMRVEPMRALRDE